MSITTETVCNALSAVVDEYLKTDYVSAKWAILPRACMHSSGTV